MNQRTCYLCAVSLTVLAMCGSAMGVEHHALLIAVSRYGQAGIPELPGAVNDVLGLWRVLAKQHRPCV